MCFAVVKSSHLFYNCMLEERFNPGQTYVLKAHARICMGAVNGAENRRGGRQVSHDNLWDQGTVNKRKTI